MPAASQGANDWIDGFLFVANMPILDFLNTEPVLADEPTELLPDFQALERWLIASGMVTSPGLRAILRGWRHSTRATAFLQKLIAFRERLREAVLRMEKGSSPIHAFLSELNSLLRQYPRHTSLRKRGAKFVRETIFSPREPPDLWAPFIEAPPSLLSQPQSPPIRKSDACCLP